METFLSTTCHAVLSLSPFSVVDFLLITLTSSLGLILITFLGCILIHHLCNWIRNHLIVSIEISGDKLGSEVTSVLYENLVTWLAANVSAQSNSCANVRHVYGESGGHQREMFYPPGFGTFNLIYKRCWIRVTRIERPEIKCQHVTYETIILSTFRFHKNILTEIMDEVKELDIEIGTEKDDDEMLIYTAHSNSWAPDFPRRHRELASVILSQETKDRVVLDLKKFLERQNWYNSRGIPYRRGYLLYGPPGCGKTSFIKGIASEIGYDICILGLSSKGITDESLNELLVHAPEKSIILMEDIDAAFKSRVYKNNENFEVSNREANLAFEGCGSSFVTFRGLLNALDGIGSTEGKIIFMTTNHLEKLDPALIRPGRADLKVHINYPNDGQLKAMFSRFYPESDDDLNRRFVGNIQTLTEKVSLADVQGLFIVFQENPEAAVEKCIAYFNDEQSIYSDDVFNNNLLYS